MSIRAALLLTALPTLAAAQDIDTSEIHACVASCLSGRGTVEFIQYGQCITDLCASLATGTGAAAEMAEAMAEDVDPDTSDIQNESFLLLGEDDTAAETEEPAPQPVVSANAGVNVDAPTEMNAGSDDAMNAVPVPVPVGDAAEEGSDGADDAMNVDIAEETPADTPAEAADGADDGMNADIADAPAEAADPDMADSEDAGAATDEDAMAANDTLDQDTSGEETASDAMAGDAMADDAMADDMADGDETVADAMADDAASPDIVADDAMAEDVMAEDAMAEDAMAEDSMAEDAMAEDGMAEDAAADATNQVIAGDTVAEPTPEPVSVAEWQVVTLQASAPPWVDGFGAIIGGEGDLQFGYLCARAGVSHLSLAGNVVASRPGVYTVVIGPAQYLTPPMVATGGRLQGGISPNDPLLAALRAGSEAEIYGPDRALVARFALKGSSAAIATALGSCF